MKTKLLRSLTLAPALVAFAATPAFVHASETSARAEAAISEVKGDAAKAALAELDTEMDRLETLIDNAPTDADKAAARARLDTLKERRSDLRKTYATARYDELKADVRAEANRLGAWAKRTFNRDEASNAKREIKDTMNDAKRDARQAGDKAYAATAAAGASMDLAAYKMRPTDTNKEEAKAALRALDARIEALEDRVDDMDSGPARDRAERRVKALEDRKDQLKGEFNKARFNALVDEVQNEWNDLVN